MVSEVTFFETVNVSDEPEDVPVHEYEGVPSPMLSIVALNVMSLPLQTSSGAAVTAVIIGFL